VKGLAIIDHSLSMKNIIPLDVSPKFKSVLTSHRFKLIATINIPFLNHYNILPVNPFLILEVKTSGYFLHDGISDGITKTVPKNYLSNIRRYIYIYRRIGYQNYSP